MFLAQKVRHERRVLRIAGKAILAIAASGMLGCTDSPTQQVEVGQAELRSAAIPSWATVSATEETAVESLARTIAVAMNDSLFRSFVLDAMAGSSVKEQKLHLASFLSGRGQALVESAPVRALGVSPREIAQWVSQIRDAEFYMPVRAHREGWNEQITPMVGFALDEDAAPIGFDRFGHRVPLLRAFAPTQPILIIAPVEASFGPQIAMNLKGLSEGRCVRISLETLGSAERRCASGVTGATSTRLSGGGAGTGFTCTWIYLGCDGGLILHEVDLIGGECGGECWAWGDPEYQVHVYARKPGQPATKGFDYQCTGDGVATAQPGVVSNDYVWDMNGTHWSGDALLLSSGQFDAIHSADPNIVLQLWEDDTNGCQNTGAAMSVADLTWGLAGIATVVAGTSDKNNWQGIANLISAAYAVTGLVWDILGDPLNGGDDFVATFYEKGHTSFSYQSNAGKNTVLVGQGRYKGWAMISYHTHQPVPGTPASMEVSPQSAWVPIGFTLPIAATVYDQNGYPLQGATVNWNSSNPSVASVNSSGVVTGHTIGTATITAQSASFNKQSAISVAAVGTAVSMSISPASLSIVSGQTQQLSVHLFDSHGFEVPITGGTVWSTQNSSVCWVDGNGLAHGQGGGQTTITATNDALTVSKLCYVSYGQQWTPVKGTLRQP